MVSVPVFLRALLVKDKGSPAKSLAPGISSPPHEERRELWLNFQARISLFKAIMLIFEASAVTWRTGIIGQPLATHLGGMCDVITDIPAAFLLSWFHHRGTLQRIDGVLL